MILHAQFRVNDPGAIENLQLATLALGTGMVPRLHIFLCFVVGWFVLNAELLIRCCWHK